MTTALMFLGAIGIVGYRLYLLVDEHFDKMMKGGVVRDLKWYEWFDLAFITLMERMKK